MWYIYLWVLTNCTSDSEYAYLDQIKLIKNYVINFWNIFETKILWFAVTKHLQLWWNLIKPNKFIIVCVKRLTPTQPNCLWYVGTTGRSVILPSIEQTTPMTIFIKYLPLGTTLSVGFFCLVVKVSSVSKIRSSRVNTKGTQLTVYYRWVS